MIVRIFSAGGFGSKAFSRPETDRNFELFRTFAPEIKFCMMSGIGKYFSLVKFAHTIFAMPFAAIAFVFAIRINRLDEVWSSAGWWWPLAVQVLLCMVFARNVAMGFNRWADRRIDAENPRTADREIPAGRISPQAALWFVGGNAAAFILTAATINALTALLSPVALGIVMAYSYCKRFTALAHLVLGLSLGIAPAGTYIAVTGTLSWPASFRFPICFFLSVILFSMPCGVPFLTSAWAVPCLPLLPSGGPGCRRICPPGISCRPVHRQAGTPR